ncbi:hypothetical protein, partial [Bradyrhizobium sp.]|uniref:hypothetical protein n=1 Tax=Bradyrhizobium sp. TaxID=376 RepID=UPI003C633F1C
MDDITREWSIVMNYSANLCSFLRRLRPEMTMAFDRYQSQSPAGDAMQVGARLLASRSPAMRPPSPSMFYSGARIDEARSPFMATSHDCWIGWHSASAHATSANAGRRTGLPAGACRPGLPGVYRAVLVVSGRTSFAATTEA